MPLAGRLKAEAARTLVLMAFAIVTSGLKTGVWSVPLENVVSCRINENYEGCIRNIVF